MKNKPALTEGNMRGSVKPYKPGSKPNCPPPFIKAKSKFSKVEELKNMLE